MGLEKVLDGITGGIDSTPLVEKWTWSDSSHSQSLTNKTSETRGEGREKPGPKKKQRSSKGTIQ